MKVGRLLLKNVTSYRHETEFRFDPRLNILIGPNGGGKSNLQKIIAVVLTQFFVRQYQVRNEDAGSVIEPLELYNKKVLAGMLSKFVGDESTQVIEIDIIPEESDVQNIAMIAKHLEKFNEELSFYEKKYKSFEPANFVDQIRRSSAFTYRIVDRKLDVSSPDDAKTAFRTYLQEFFVFMRVANKVPEATLSSPIFFFSSDRALTKSFEVQAGQLTEDHYQNGFRSAFSAATGQTNLLQWGAQHFVRLYRRAQAKAGAARGKITEDFLRDEPDVKLLDRYLKKLGYQWDFVSDEDQTKFKFVLKREDVVIENDLFSSGEREIVHFLLAMFALNVRDGLVLVDEPELHLHPRWQIIFLGLFRDMAPERRNQFLICTHSPIFVTPDTINSVIRIYKGGSGGSRKVALSEVALPNKTKLVRMINSQNNERLFFADRVVLVEGPSDRLVFTALLEAIAARVGDNSATEIVDVGGKHNFESYQVLLGGMQTQCITIADQDYLAQVGSQAVKEMFALDSKRVTDAILDDKKSVDRASLIVTMRKSIEDNDLGRLSIALNYIESRHRSLKADRTPEEDAALSADVVRLRASNTVILDGEIEDYLPAGRREISQIVELVSNRNWVVEIPDATKRVHLLEIGSSILGLDEKEKSALLEEAGRGQRPFPSPIVGDKCA